MTNVHDKISPPSHRPRWVALVIVGLVLLIAAGWGDRWLIHACGTPWSEPAHPAELPDHLRHVSQSRILLPDGLTSVRPAPAHVGAPSAVRGRR
ncbi:MAG: hypothetical protein ACRDRK_08620 [Pseudonocardia sp.]